MNPSTTTVSNSYTSATIRPTTTATTTTTSFFTSPIVSSSTSTSTFAFTDLKIDFSDPATFSRLLAAHRNWSREVKKFDEDSDSETVVGGSCTSSSGLDELETSDGDTIFENSLDYDSDGSEEEEEAPFAAILMAMDILEREEEEEAFSSLLMAIDIEEESN